MLNTVYDDLVAFMMERATPEEILAFKPSDAAQARTIELLDKQDEDALTLEEARELEQIAQVDLIVSVLKARALAELSRK